MRSARELDHLARCDPLEPKQTRVRSAILFLAAIVLVAALRLLALG